MSSIIFFLSTHFLCFFSITSKYAFSFFKFSNFSFASLISTLYFLTVFNVFFPKFFAAFCNSLFFSILIFKLFLATSKIWFKESSIFCSLSFCCENLIKSKFWFIWFSNIFISLSSCLLDSSICFIAASFFSFSSFLFFIIIFLCSFSKFNWASNSSICCLSITCFLSSSSSFAFCSWSSWFVFLSDFCWFFGAVEPLLLFASLFCSLAFAFFVFVFLFTFLASLILSYFIIVILIMYFFFLYINIY